MTDLKAAAEAAKIQPHLGHHAEKLRDAAIDAFRGACTPDAILALYAERDEALERERQTFKDAAEINTRAEAALAVMECEGDADDRLAPVREDVIRMRLEQLFADKPVEQWGPMGLAKALSPNVEALVAAAVSNEQLRHASPRPEAVGEDGG